MSEFIYPQLKQPPHPEIAIIDLDSLLFQAASSGEQVWYVAKDIGGNEVARFDSAKAHKYWLEEIELFGADPLYGYEGVIENLSRETIYEILPVENCYKSFDKMLKDWVKQSGCPKFKCWVSKKSGAKNFRYDIATLNQYKKGRENTRKPHHLEAVRKYAMQHPNVVKAVGKIEVDDLVVAVAEKYKHKGCLLSIDKDSRQVMGTHVMIIDQMEQPVFSSKKIVGKLDYDGKKVTGYGILFLLWQSLTGDTVDGILGCKGMGKKKAYDLLSKYSGVCMSHLPEAVDDVCEVYKGVYGDSYKYNHCYTNEELQVSWQGVFTENVRLLWMLRHKDDKAEFVLDHLPEDL